MTRLQGMRHSRFWSNRNCRYGTIIVGLILLMAIIGPLFAPYDPTQQNLEQILQPPSLKHICGTDFYGRDLLSRLLHGSRISLGVSLSATFLTMLIGIVLGLLAGYFRGWLDKFLMRIVDILLGFPRLFIILLIVGISRSTLLMTIVVLAGFSWMEIARLVRAETRSILTTNYLMAAQALGLNHFRLIIAYILPNLRGMLLTSTNLLIASMLTIESSLSFLGLGVNEPNASWGTLLSQGRLDPTGAWWVALFAGIAIIITVVGFNLLGDGLNQIQSESRT